MIFELISIGSVALFIIEKYLRVITKYDTGRSYMQSNKKFVINRLLWLLTHDELKQLYKSSGGNECFDEWSRGFLIKKIQEIINPLDLFENETVAPLLLERITKIITFIEKTIQNMEKSDLFKIYQKITSKDLTHKEALKKSEIVQRILDEIPLNAIIENKLFKDRLKPKYVTISDIKSIKKNLEDFNTQLNWISNMIRLVSNRTYSSDEALKNIFERVDSLSNMLKSIFDTGRNPDLETYMEALYEEAIQITKKPSPTIFRDIDKRLQRKMGISERIFILKGMELLLIHYLLSEVKKLSWQPRFEDFIKVLKDELNKESHVKERVDIPSLRDRVCKRLGIKEEVFDDLLEQAWKEDLVKLEAGLPIGEFNAKYFVTKDGKMFYYIRTK